jgi:hypothetical protein
MPPGSARGTPWIKPSRTWPRLATIWQRPRPLVELPDERVGRGVIERLAAARRPRLFARFPPHILPSIERYTVYLSIPRRAKIGVFARFGRVKPPWR